VLLLNMMGCVGALIAKQAPAHAVGNAMALLKKGRASSVDCYRVILDACVLV
jgi:hypothetical protein